MRLQKPRRLLRNGAGYLPVVRKTLPDLESL